MSLVTAQKQYQPQDKNLMKAPKHPEILKS